MGLGYLFTFWHKCMVDVVKYTIHGSYRVGSSCFFGSTKVFGGYFLSFFVVALLIFWGAFLLEVSCFLFCTFIHSSWFARLLDESIVRLGSFPRFQLPKWLQKQMSKIVA